MSFQKRFFRIAVLCALVAAVYYFGRNYGTWEKDSGKTDSNDKNEKETIYVWYTEETLNAYMNDAAVSFGEKEGVRVIPVLVSDSEYLEKINEATLYGEQMPDAFLISNDSLEKAYLAGFAEEITDEGGICTEEHFPGAALSAVEYHGRRIGYPFFYETNALIYNVSYLDEWARQQAQKEVTPISGQEGNEGTEGGSNAGNDGQGALPPTEADIAAYEAQLEEKTAFYRKRALPETMSGILGVADTFEAPEGVEGIMEWDVTDIFYNYWFVGKYMIVGGDAGDDADKIDIVNQETESCLRFYAGLNQFFSIDRDAVDYDSVVQDFIDGKVIFIIGTSDILKKLDEAKESGRFSYEYGIAPMPDVTDMLESRSMSVTDVVAVNSYSAHRNLANRFAAYLVTEKADELYAWTGKMPACSDVQSEDVRMAAFFSEYAESVPLPKLMTTGNFWMRLEALFYDVWNGADVTEELAELHTGMDVK